MIKDTIQISTVLSFINQIQKNEYDPQFTYFYRGHSDYSFELKPSVYRNEGYVENEETMFNELITHNPSEFLNCRNTIDYLVKMQHYGLPTRLLDITTNPLISLFFACIDANNDEINFKKGEVIVFKVPHSQIKYYDSDTVAILANLSKMKRTFTFDSSKQIEQFNENDGIPYLLHSIRQEKISFQSIIDPNHIKSVLCVKGKMDNPRIVNQSGAFFLFGCLDENKEFVTINDEWIASKMRLIIINKKQILEELKLMGITEKFVYPHLEKYTEFLKTSFFKKKDSITMYKLLDD